MVSAPLTDYEIASFAVDDIIERVNNVYAGNGLARARVYELISEELIELAMMLKFTDK